MTHRLATNYAKNYCNRTLTVKVIVENVVTCFLGGHSVYLLRLRICLTTVTRQFRYEIFSALSQKQTSVYDWCCVYQ